MDKQSIFKNSHSFVMTNAKENQKTFAFAFTLAILFPFGGLIYTLWHWREKWAKNVFWLICAYMGAVFIYWPEGTILGDGGDGGRYALWLVEMYQDPIVSFVSIFKGYLSDPKIMDLYQPLLTYCISRFTYNGHVLFTIYAIVFGFFYSCNIWYVLERIPNVKLGYFYIFIALYFFICPISQINGVRMWTALHVYVYAMMPYLLEKDYSKICFLLLIPLIHFSFLYITIFALIYVFIPYTLKTESQLFISFSLVVFIITLFINSINMDWVRIVLEEYSPDIYSGRINGFVQQEYLERRIEANSLKNWYVIASGLIKHWVYNILLLLLLPYLKKYFKNNKSMINLYVFILLLSSITNLMSLIPSGGRFQLIAQMFKIPMIILTITSLHHLENIFKYINIALILLVLPLIFEIRKFFDFYSITLISGNFVTIFFWENNIPLINYIKMIL